MGQVSDGGVAVCAVEEAMDGFVIQGLVDGLEGDFLALDDVGEGGVGMALEAIGGGDDDFPGFGVFGSLQRGEEQGEEESEGKAGEAGDGPAGPGGCTLTLIRERGV